jgi:hypothetical protein
VPSCRCHICPEVDNNNLQSNNNDDFVCNWQNWLWLSTFYLPSKAKTVPNQCSNRTCALSSQSETHAGPLRDHTATHRVQFQLALFAAAVHKLEWHSSLQRQDQLLQNCTNNTDNNASFSCRSGRTLLQSQTRAQGCWPAGSSRMRDEVSSADCCGNIARNPLAAATLQLVCHA